MGVDGRNLPTIHDTIHDTIHIGLENLSNTDYQLEINDSYQNRFSIIFKSILKSCKSCIITNKKIPILSFNTYLTVINTLYIQPNKYMIEYSNVFNNIVSINLDNLSHKEYILQIVPFGTPEKQVYSNHKTYIKTFIK